MKIAETRPMRFILDSIKRCLDFIIDLLKLQDLFDGCKRCLDTFLKIDDELFAPSNEQAEKILDLFQK